MWGDPPGQSDGWMEGSGGPRPEAAGLGRESRRGRARRLCTAGVIGPGAPERGLVSTSLDARPVGRVLRIFVLNMRGEGRREEGQGGDRKSV